MSDFNLYPPQKKKNSICIYFSFVKYCSFSCSIVWELSVDSLRLESPSCRQPGRGDVEGVLDSPARSASTWRAEGVVVEAIVRQGDNGGRKDVENCCWATTARRRRDWRRELPLGIVVEAIGRQSDDGERKARWTARDGEKSCWARTTAAGRAERLIPSDRLSL
jgi:hypothetical protein